MRYRVYNNMTQDETIRVVLRRGYVKTRYGEDKFYGSLVAYLLALAGDLEIISGLTHFAAERIMIVIFAEERCRTANNLVEPLA